MLVFDDIKYLSVSYIILFLIASMFIADAVNTILDNTGYSQIRLSLFIRIVVDVYFLFLLITKSAGLRVYRIILTLALIYLLGNIFSLSQLQTELDIFQNLIIISKYTFVFVCWEILLAYFKIKRRREQLINLYELIVIIESITVVVGFVFNVNMLSSYQDLRFGYKGFIPAQNEATGFFIIAVYYYSYKYFSIKNTNLLLLTLIFVSSAGMITGTKGCLIFIPIILFLNITYHFNIIFYLKKLLFIIPFMLIVLAIIFKYKDYIISKVSLTYSYLSYQYYHSAGENIISLLLSGRGYKLNSLIDAIYQHWQLPNILFGGTNLYRYSVEMDPIDLFAQIGLVGLLLYYYYYIIMLGIFNNNRSWDIILFGIIWLTVSTLGGHLIFSAINSIYLAILLFVLKTSNN